MATLKLKTDVCVVMATGSGKSMVAFIPPMIEKDRISVAVLPLRSLVSDYQRRLDEIGLRYEHYTSGNNGRLCGSANLILVSIDTARTAGWGTAIGELNERRPVVRYIFDEAHFALTANDFRKCFLDIGDLREFGMQFVLLSGTVPPAMEKDLMGAFGLIKGTPVFRTATDRPELQYIVEDTVKDVNANMERAANMFRLKKTSFKTEDRALLYVPRLGVGKKLASLLECPFYNGSDDLNDKDRHRMYHDWIRGKTDVMVCTSAFGAGNDYPHVRLVMHVGNPQEMIGFTQEVSRAGRDKQSAECYVFPVGKTSKPSLPPDYSGTRAIGELLINSDQCVRFAITNFNDVKGVTCKDSLHGMPCNRCQKRDASATQLVKL